jgi:DNA-binding NtrC family response regulator
MRSILVLTEKTDAKDVIQSALGKEYEVESAVDIQSTLQKAGSQPFAFFFVDVEILGSPNEGKDRYDIFHKLWALCSNAEIIITPKERIREAVRAVKAGAGEYVIYPIESAEVKYVIESLFDSGLHDFLSEDPEIAEMAEERGVRIRDVRKQPPRKDLHFLTGKIEEVTSLKVAILGTDSAIGKRTTAWILVDAPNEVGYRAEMVGTGQGAGAGRV